VAYDELKNSNKSRSDQSQGERTLEDENSLPTSRLKTTRVRLFCDICEEFDLHDTEDCPQQSMPQEAQLEQQTHSKYNAVKATPRAYCDNCEQFGHEEADCPNRIEEF
jgi:CAP-Gly domain-containing linker protein 1